MYSLSSVGWLTMQIAWGHFLCVTSMPNLCKFSFPRMFRSCPPVMKNGVSSLIHPLYCVLTIIFPKILIVSLVNPQYKSFILFSTGCILRFGYLTLISCNAFCFKNLRGLLNLQVCSYIQSYPSRCLSSGVSLFRDRFCRK